MTADEIRTIEEKLNITVPRFWKETVTEYPFRSDSLAAGQSLLLNTVEAILEENSLRYKDEYHGYDMLHAFFIGHFQEANYFLDLNNPHSGVYIFLLESWEQHHEFKTWDDFVVFISQTYDEFMDECTRHQLERIRAAERKQTGER